MKLLHALLAATILLLLLLLLLPGCGEAPSGPQGEAVLVVEARLDADATRVREAHVWQGGHGPANRELELEWIPGAFPLRPDFALVQATVDETPVDASVRHYADWVDVDLALPGDAEPGARHRLDLAYELRGAWRDGDDGVDVLRMQQVGPRSPLSYRNVSLRVVAPDDAALGLWVANGYGAYEPVPLERAGEPVEGTRAWTASLGASPPGQPLLWQLGVRSLSLQPQTPPYLATLVEQAGVVPWALLLMLVAAVVLRLQRADRVLASTRPMHWVLWAVAAWELLGQQLRYWWREAALPGVAGSVAFTEVATSAGLVFLLGAFLRAQDRAIRERQPEAYELQLALPLVLALALPMLWVRTAYLLLPLVGLPWLLPWLRRPVALAMGADLHLLVEAVSTHGTIAVPDLAATLGVQPSVVRELLVRHPELPVVHDRGEDRVLSASTAALRDDLRLCPSCGGGTTIAAQDLLACPYCEREYASAHVPQSAAPVPLLVRSLAALLEVLARGLNAWAWLLALAFGLMAVLGHPEISGFAALIAGGLFVALARLVGSGLRRLAEGLRAGHGYVAIALLLGLGSPLVLPAIALLRLRTPRVRLHFGRFDLADLAQRLERDGQIGLPELARALRTRWDEALEVATHLCGNGRLDAVLDRAGQRVIARSRLRELAAAGTCRSCGGIVGIVQGAVRCHHCGTTAAAA